MTENSQTVLLAMITGMRDDAALERKESHESRAGIHRRLDEMNGAISRLDTTAALSGQVDVNVRDEIESLKDTFTSEISALKAKIDNNITPTINEWKRIRALGLGVVGIVALGGVSFGAAIMWAGDAVRYWLLHWLGLGH